MKATVWDFRISLPVIKFTLKKKKLYLPICTADVNHFVASVCPLHILFLERFEYHWQNMILLSPQFCNLYQIYVLRIGGALILTLGVRHFLLKLHCLDVVPVTADNRHIVVCLIKNCVSTPKIYQGLQNSFVR